MKNLFLLIYCLLCLACKSSSQQNLGVDLEFNRHASQFFFENLKGIDLRPLNEVDICILKKTVKNDLDELNDWSSVLIRDNFLVRQYVMNLDRASLTFSFVRDIKLNQFYFICIPELEKNVFDIKHYYEQINDSIFRYKGEHRVVRLNSSTIDTFLNNSFFKLGSSTKENKIKMLRYILKEAFKELYLLRTDKYSFKEKLDQRINSKILTNESYQEILRLIDTNSFDTEIFSMDGIGDVFFIYSIYDNLKFEVYYLPETYRHLAFSGNDTGTKYKCCHIGNGQCSD